MSIMIWASAAVLYLVFRFWYDGSRKPLTPDEIETFIVHLKERAEEGRDEQDIAVVRKFMEEDDGREFLMANLVEFNPSPVTHPDSGDKLSAQALLQEYFRPLMKTFLGRAGHPVLMGRAVCGYLDAWNTPPDPGWHVAGFIRYRSRRDAMQATLADASFQGIHKYKVAALRQTFAFPTQNQGGLYASPRVTVALVVALTAALFNLLLLI